jgi:CRISPR-associated protein Cas5d
MHTFTLEVWGEYACFTRPEFKVERFSYPVITPSAARAIFDAIYLEFDKRNNQPAMRWQPHRIEIIQPIHYIALMRNEVKEKISERAVKTWIKDPRTITPIIADATEEAKGRTQRQTMALKNVRYRISAQAVLYREDPELRTKIERSFERRARNGQCFYQPYLGCREFSAYFRLLEDPDQLRPPAAVTENIGWMVYDTFDLTNPGTNTDKPSISLFNATVQNGVLEIPSYTSGAVRKPGGA